MSFGGQRGRFRNLHVILEEKGYGNRESVRYQFCHRSGCRLLGLHSCFSMLSFDNTISVVFKDHTSKVTVPRTDISSLHTLSASRFGSITFGVPFAACAAACAWPPVDHGWNGSLYSYKVVVVKPSSRIVQSATKSKPALSKVKNCG
jgi:hypothetical protein